MSDDKVTIEISREAALTLEYGTEHLGADELREVHRACRAALKRDKRYRVYIHELGAHERELATFDLTREQLFQEANSIEVSHRFSNACCQIIEGEQ